MASGSPDGEAAPGVPMAVFEAVARLSVPTPGAAAPGGLAPRPSPARADGDEEAEGPPAAPGVARRVRMMKRPLTGAPGPAAAGNKLPRNAEAGPSGRGARAGAAVTAAPYESCSSARLLEAERLRAGRRWPHAPRTRAEAEADGIWEPLGCAPPGCGAPPRGPRSRVVRRALGPPRFPRTPSERVRSSNQVFCVALSCRDDDYRFVEAPAPSDGRGEASWRSSSARCQYRSSDVMATACQNGYMRFQRIGMCQPRPGRDADAARRPGGGRDGEGARSGTTTYLHAVQVGWTILDMKFCNTGGAWADGVGDGAHRSLGNVEKLLYSSWDRRIQMVHLDEHGMPAEGCEQTVRPREQPPVMSAPPSPPTRGGPTD